MRSNWVIIVGLYTFFLVYNKHQDLNFFFVDNNKYIDKEIDCLVLFGYNYNNAYG